MRFLLDQFLITLPLNPLGVFATFIRPFNKQKLQYWSTKYLFLDYLIPHNVYLCLDWTFDRVYITHHFVFDESCFLVAMSTLPNVSIDSFASLTFPLAFIPMPFSSSHSSSISLSHPPFNQWF